MKKVFSVWRKLHDYVISNVKAYLQMNSSKYSTREETRNENHRLVQGAEKPACRGRTGKPWRNPAGGERRTGAWGHVVTLGKFKKKQLIRSLLTSSLSWSLFLSVCPSFLFVLLCCVLLCCVVLQLRRGVFVCFRLSVFVILFVCASVCESFVHSSLMLSSVFFSCFFSLPFEVYLSTYPTFPRFGGHFDVMDLLERGGERANNSRCVMVFFTGKTI